MRRRSVLLGAMLLSACNRAPDAPAPAPSVSRERPASSPTPMPSPLPAPADSITDVETPALAFRYSYPAAAARIPALAALLDSEREALRRDALRAAEADRRDAAGSDRPFHQHDAIVAWSVVTETPRFLSLSAELYAFTGGAHGSPGFDALLWDKQAGARLKPEAVFATPAALQAAVGAPFCDAIDRERAQRRGAPVVRSSDGYGFNDCPPVSDATLILGSTNRRAINRIGLLVGPYVAGPYAEGTYEVTLPVTPALRGAVKPAYRDAFALNGGR